MLAANAEKVVELTDTELEFYPLVSEEYKAMKDGRTSTIDEMKEKLKRMREERG